MAETIIADRPHGSPTDAATDDVATYEQHAARQRAVFLEYFGVVEHMRLGNELPQWVRDGHPDLGRMSSYENFREAGRLAARAARGRPTKPRYYLDADHIGVTVNEREDHRMAFSGRSFDLPRHIDLHELMPSQLGSLIARLKLDLERERTLLRLRERRIMRTAARGEQRSGSAKR